MPIILSSNIFLLVPTLISVWKGEWVYFAFCAGLCVASPVYHYLSLYNRKSKIFPFFRAFDWVVGIGSYGGMYYYIFYKVPVVYQISLATMLTLTIVFFIYGFKFGDYDKSHPWFHIIAFLVSGLIIFMVP